MSDRVEALKKKRDQINAQLKAIDAREKSKQRKLDTRRKVLIGGVVLKMLKNGEMPKERLATFLSKHLDEKNKKVFGDILN